MTEDLQTHLIVWAVIVFLCVATTLVSFFANQKQRPIYWISVSSAIMAVCASYVIYGIYFAEGVWKRERYSIENILLPGMFLFFLLLPAGGSIVAGQLLLRLPVSRKAACWGAVALGCLLALVTPIGILIGACGLQGACL